MMVYLAINHHPSTRCR